MRASAGAAPHAVSTTIAAAVCEGLGEQTAITTKRLTARSLAFYLLTLCPIALLLAMMFVSIDRAARIPLWDSLADAAVYVLGFLATGAIGHLCAAIVLPPVRSKALASRPWAFPVACGIAFSLATATCVENTTDVLGRWLGHAYENTMVAATATAWSAVATACVIGLDAIICRLPRRG